MNRIFMCAALLSISACTTTGGREFETADVTKIQEGVTTTAEVERLLGVPIRKDSWVDGTEQWTYHWTATKHTPTMMSLVSADLNRAQRQDKQVEVKFKGGVVTECVYATFSNEDAPGQTFTSALYMEGQTHRMRCQDAR